MLILGDPFVDTRFAGVGVGIPALPAPRVRASAAPAAEPLVQPQAQAQPQPASNERNSATGKHGRPSTPRHPPLRLSVPEDSDRRENDDDGMSPHAKLARRNAGGDSDNADAGSEGNRHDEFDRFDDLDDDDEFRRAVEESKRMSGDAAPAALVTAPPPATLVPTGATGGSSPIDEIDAVDPAVAALFNDQDTDEKMPEADAMPYFAAGNAGDDAAATAPSAAAAEPAVNTEASEFAPAVLSEEDKAAEAADAALTVHIMWLRTEKLAGVSGGVLLSMYKNRNKIGKSSYNNLKALLVIMQTNPAVYAYISRLPPVDPLVHDSYAAVGSWFGWPELRPRD